MEISTKALHANSLKDTYAGSTTMPIFQTSAFGHETAEELEAIFRNQKPGFSYSRLGNPTINQFERQMVDLEGGFAATACSSGSAAVAMTLLTILKSGDNIIVPTGLYGGTLDLFRDLEGFGVTTIFVDPYTPEEIDGHVTERTRALFTEFVGNPKLNVADVRSLSAFAKEKKLPLIVDSTTMTPAVVNPLRLGADIVIHSSSKYINGGGNAISGIIVDGGTFQWDDDRYDVFGTYRKFKKGAFTARLRNSVWRDIGACLSPVNAFLNLEGIETLSLRMERICDNALALAQAFSEMEEISVVNYPGLPDNPYQQLVQEELGGRAGGILTIRVGSKERAFSIINHLKYAINASNIGDTKTLVVHPASTIFVHSTEEEKQAAGVYEDLIRVSVGIEYIEDIKEDFRQAIAAAFVEEEQK